MPKSIQSYLLAVCFAAVSLSASPAVSQDNLPTVPVTKDFSISSSQWTSGLGKTHLAWRVIEQNGQIMVCGAIASDKHSTMSRHNRAILRKGFVKVQGKKVLRGLGYFTVAKSGTNILDAHATCKPIAAKVPPKSRVLLGFDPVRVRG